MAGLFHIMSGITEMIVYKKSSVKPAWAIWNNRYTFEFPNNIDRNSLRYYATMLMEYERRIHLSSVTIESCLAVEPVKTGEAVTKREGLFYVHQGGTLNGYRNYQSDLMYRWALQVGRENLLGRPSHYTYHGAITRDDVIIGEEGELTLISANEIKQSVRERYIGDFDTLWCYLVSPPTLSNMQAPGQYIPARKLYGALPVDAHAATRRRKRATPLGIDAMGKYYDLLRALYVVGERCRKEIFEQTTYIFPNFYTEAVATLGGLLTTGQKVRDYLNGNYPDENGQPTQIQSRFGSTRADIMTALSEGKAWAEEDLPDLQANNHPEPGPGGDMYISPEKLQPYLDAMDDWLGKLAPGFDFDWYNPRAYPRVGADEEPERQSDFIELLW